MDTQKMAHAIGTKKVGFSKALIALTAAASCLVIYILACVLSPVTWSPDSSKIALLVAPMDEDPAVFAIFTYDIATGQRLLLDEVKKDGVLSAPAWSPDGKWIAYYKVDPSPPKEPPAPSQTDPNATVPTDKPTEKAGSKIEVEKVPEQAGAKEVAEELFSEENRMLPSFLLEIVEEEMDKEDKDRETLYVKLMVVRPDGTERKILQVMKWDDDEEVRRILISIRPEWSKDSKHLFYARMLVSEEFFYISSLNIATGEAYAHLLSSIGISAASPDGKWLASLIEADSEKVLLNVARIDGTAHKYYKLDSEMVTGQHLFPTLMWSPDSKHILIPAKEHFLLVNTETGNVEKYDDTSSDEAAYGLFSLVDNKLYYIAIHESDDPNATEMIVNLKCINLQNRQMTTLFQLSDFPNIDDGGLFAISPNGKIVLLRCVIKDKNGNERPALIFWDEKTQKIVKTNPWLVKILFPDEALIFEEKLIGKWKGKDGETVVLEGMEEKAYKITVTNNDGEKETGTANLFRQKNMMFLCVSFDDLDEIVYVKVDRIEPKLLLRGMEYDEAAEMLSKPPELLQQETTDVDYAFEGTRIQ